MFVRSIKYKAIILCLFFLSSQIFSAEKNSSSQNSGGSRKFNSLFIQGTYGNTIAGDDEEDRPSTLTAIDQEHDLGTGYQIALGWRWRQLALEGIYGDFGKPKVVYKDTLIVEKSVRFFGGGFHLMLWFFDLRLGWASFRGNRKFTVDPMAQSTFSVDPLDSKITSGGNYFGIGLNFNLGSHTEFVLDYTGYVFREKPVTYTIDGASETFPKADAIQNSKEELTGFVGILGLGLRFYF